MPAEADVHSLCAPAERLTRRLAALLWLGLGACQVDIQDGVYACRASADCPSGLQCDLQAKRCTRQPLPGSESNATSQSDSGADSERRDAGADRTPRADAAIGPRQPDVSPSSGPAVDGGGPSERSQPAADSGSAAHSTGGSGGAGAQAGSGGEANAGRVGANAAAGSGGGAEMRSAATSCPPDSYCYGFESGALDPSGALWPSPSDGSGGLPTHDELTTAPFPASSRNAMLVSRPSSQDGWPKATVGFTGPRTAFSKLVVSFDYAAGDKLASPNPRVILFRFVGTPERNGDSVNVGVLDENAMLEVQTAGPDALSTIGRAAAPGVITHVALTFERSLDACMVSVAYGGLPLQAAAFPCEVDHWQIELGLDLLETPPEKYNDEYVAYFDNLQLSTTP